MFHSPFDQPSYKVRAKPRPKKKAKAKVKAKVKAKAKKRARKKPEREDRWKERKRFQAPAKVFQPAGYEVIADLDRDVAKGFVETHHYAGSLPNSAYVSGKLYGLYDKKKKRLVGVAAYGSPGAPKVLSSSFPNLEDLERVGLDVGEFERSGRKVWIPRPLKLGQHATELQRLVLLDAVPFNSESWFVAKTFDHLRGKKGVRGVVSFSDPHYGHVGTVYKSLSAYYTGMSKPSYVWRYKSTGTEVANRDLTKIRAADPCHGSGRSTSGWRGAVERLVAHGARSPGRGCLRRWLKAVLPTVATRERHGGKHRYVWGLTKGQEGDLRQRFAPGGERPGYPASPGQESRAGKWARNFEDWA